MGWTRIDPDQWKQYANQVAGKTTQQVFRSRGMQDDLNPSKIGRRESRDSAANPNSTPMIVGGDVTGSMGELARELVQVGMPTLTKEIFERKPVSDPHLMFMAIGDAHTDEAPLQVTQFESSIVLADQMQRIYVEGNGGGNGSESYHLPWWFASQRCDIDATKRGRKGLIFTYGDESVPPPLTPAQLKRVTGDTIESALSAQQLLTMAERSWDVFHIIVGDSGYARNRLPELTAEWRALMGERAIVLRDHTKMAELIVSLAQVTAGQAPAQVAASWSGDTALVIQDALQGTAALAKRPATGRGVVRL